MAKPYTVGIFSFNTEAISFCDNTKKTSGFFSKCVLPDFVDDVAARFLDWSPDILAVGLQESAIPGDKLIDAFAGALKKGYFSERASQHGYIKIHQDRLTGLGQEGFLGFVRGLRLALFIRDDLFVVPASRYRISTGSYRCSKQTLGKGALSATLTLPNPIKALPGAPQTGLKNVKYQFITAHLPYLADDISGGQGLAARNDCMNGIYSKLIDGQDNDNVFLFGDLNYRIVLSEGQTDTDLVREIGLNLTGEGDTITATQYDQLMSTKLPGGFKEGLVVGGKSFGPNYMPTCKLVKKRGKECDFELNSPTGGSSECYVTSKGLSPRVPSWCDRILYSSDQLEPAIYTSLNSGNIRLSDHSAVVANFFPK